MNDQRAQRVNALLRAGGSFAAVPAQDSVQTAPKIAYRGEQEVTWGCLGAINSSRYVQDSSKILPRSPQVPQKLTREYFTTQARGVVKPSWALLELFLVYLGLFKDEISKKIYEILSWYLQYSI